jgi:hypothetical protein
MKENGKVVATKNTETNTKRQILFLIIEKQTFTTESFL